MITQQSLQNKLTIQQGSRLLEFDILKGIAILLVLCGHSISSLSSDEPRANIFFSLIYSFHMPLFMLISGFFSANTLSLPCKELFSKKFWQLIYPTISFGLIFLICDILIFNEPVKSKMSTFITSFWFLKSCFLCFLILGVALKLSHGNRLWGSLLAFLISQIIPFFKIAHMLPFFILGYLLSENKNLLRKKPAIQFIISSTLFVGTFILIRHFDLDQVNLAQIKSQLASGNFFIVNLYAFCQFSRLIIGILGSWLVISVVFWLTNKWKDHFDVLNLSVYGKFTLGIYIIQTYLLENLLARFLDLKNIDTIFFSFIFVPLVSIMLMEVCYRVIKGLNKCHIKKLLFDGWHK